MKLLDKLYTTAANADVRQFAVSLAAYFAVITMLPELMKGPGGWLLWPVVLLSQNFAFTFVSRARSSASIMRHAKASLMSNGIWIMSQVIMLGPMFDKLTGKNGRPAQIAAELVYTITTMSGSLIAHYFALKTEKGKNAVGASKLYAQIPVAEYKEIQELLAEYRKSQAFETTVDAVADELRATPPEAPFGDHYASGTFKVLKVHVDRCEGSETSLQVGGLWNDKDRAEIFASQQPQEQGSRYVVTPA